jgi:hypothetical protein
VKQNCGSEAIAVNAMKSIKNFPPRNCGKHHSDAPGRMFVVWAALVAIGLIVVSIAFGVGIDPGVSMLVYP